MSQRIQVRVPRYNFEVEIELLEDDAPHTVKALLDTLPATGLVTSESRYGRVVCLHLPDYPGPLPPENATSSPAAGDALLFAGESGVELVVYYQREGGVSAGIPFDAGGDKQGNRIGTVFGDGAAEEAAGKIWSEGAAWGAAGESGSRAVEEVADDREASAAAIEARCQEWRIRTCRDHFGPPAAAGRRLALILPECDVRTEVELLDELAPHSCEHIWNNLPLEIELVHGRFSGPEVFPRGSGWQWEARAENQTAFPIPGDMMLYIGPPPRVQFAYFYDRGAIPTGSTRPEAGNRVGRSINDFNSFAEQCWRIGYEGVRRLVIDRVPC